LLTLPDRFFLKKYRNLKQIKSNYFLNSLCESLSKFVDKKIKIFLTLQQLNKNLVNRLDNKKIKILKKSLVKLNRYQHKRNPFFMEGLNTLFVCSQRQNSANLIAEFISTQLKNLKHHNFFLRFIKRCLTTFKNSGYSKLEGLKIKIKGRINRRPRARHRFYKMGKEIPLLSIDSKIHYAEKTSFTPNGTLGVKVWTI
jgi:Txe/YoeB family toxin of Txe-Axe toxin-antitoxin module